MYDTRIYWSMYGYYKGQGVGLSVRADAQRGPVSTIAWGKLCCKGFVKGYVNV